ncbi:MAG: DNA-binding response regulator [Planctomycetota bacterium]|nr:MAG: DNA-binding response regulator [Planctomycetota bacterium]
MTHILVVEDEEHLAVGIKFNLEAEGYRVTAVGDGPSALESIERNGVDLVILDLMLPGMSGYAVCEKLRQAGKTLPVLMLTARTLAEDRKRGFDVGADQYMMKPFDLDELMSRVKNLLARHGSANGSATRPVSSGAIRRFGRAEVNFDTFEVTVAGTPVKLTQLEMKLLRYFMDREGRVISRDELLENVWDMPGHLYTRAPDQFIRRLRKTFEENPAQPRHFLTIRDAGYRFVSGGEKRLEVGG